MKLPGTLSTMLSHSRRFAMLGAMCAVALGLSGCGQVNGSRQVSYAQLRVIDASPDAGGVDIQVGTNILTYNIGFGSVVAYTPVTPGTYTISANQASSRSVVTSTRGTLNAGTQYTYLIGSSSAGVQSQLLTDQSQPAPGNQSLIRILDQASRIGSLDIYFIPQGGTLLTTRPIATGVNYNDIRAGISIPTNTYQIVILPAGTVPVAATATTPATVSLYTSAATQFSAGSARTLVLLDTQITTTPAAQVIIVSDYDSPYATQ